MANTCYVNALLQMLYSLPQFVEAISPLQEGRCQVSSICDLSKDISDTTKHGAATAQTIKLAVDKSTDKFRGYFQRYAHEFLGNLLDRIHEELVKQKIQTKKGTPTSKPTKKRNEQESNNSLLPTDELFRLNVEVSLMCKSCNYSM